MFLSVSNIVIAQANTGNAAINKKEVIKIEYANNGNLVQVIPLALIKNIVTIKFIAPKIELKPAKCKLKIKQSTAALLCPIKLLKGG
jgi:hypothetical protein